MINNVVGRVKSLCAISSQDIDRAIHIVLHISSISIGPLPFICGFYVRHGNSSTCRSYQL